MRNKYVTVASDYMNCPMCDGLSDGEIVLYKTIRSFLNDVIRDFNRARYKDLIDVDSSETVVRLYYYYRHHAVDFIRAMIVIKGVVMAISTVDNGSGKLIWRKMEELPK